jgi:ABC-2 type transport system permease protein
MMIPLRALIVKDLRLFFSDRRAVIMSFVAPILIASFFGYIFGGNGGKTETSRISVLLVDQDGSSISRGIFDDLKANKLLDLKISALDAAREAVRKGTATVAVVVPKDFGTNAGRAFFRPGEKPKIALLYDPSHSAEQGMVQGILTGSVMQVVSKEMFGGATGQTVVKESIADIDKSSGMAPADKQSLRGLLQGVEQWNERSLAVGASGQTGISAGLTVPYQIREEAVTGRVDAPYNGYAHAFGGMSVQFILFMGVDVGIGLLLQRQRGLWKRLRAAPLSKGLLLGSRAISAAMISMLILVVVGLRVGEDTGGRARALDFGNAGHGDAGRRVGACIYFPAMAADGHYVCADSLGDGWPGCNDVAGAGHFVGSAADRTAAAERRGFWWVGSEQIPLGSRGLSGSALRSQSRICFIFFVIN